MNLGSLPVGSLARIDDVDVDPEVSLRLRELGLRSGALVRVAQRSIFGGRVIQTGFDADSLNSRLGVDGATARRITVVPA